MMGDKALSPLRDPVASGASNIDVSVLVVSCDKYRDLWAPFFTLFFKYWPDCPYRIYLCSNEASYEDRRVNTILSGPDRSWSTNLKRCLERLTTECLILFQEDFLFSRSVNTKKVAVLVTYLLTHEAACLRLMPYPPPEKVINVSLGVGEIAKGVPYRVSLQTAIWRRDVLYELLKDGESPWDFEYAGSIRSNSTDKQFLSVIRDNRERWPLEYFGTAIVQGKWVRQAVALCAREGIRIDRKQRAIESPTETLQRKSLNYLRRMKKRVLRLKDQKNIDHP